jgi:uncharacterized protein YceK
MSSIRQLCCIFILTACLCCCSGCATILGGIIGHQSGETCAGMAIGAAVDFGGCVINGIGGLFTDREKEIQQKTILDSEKGRITLPKNAFSVDRTKKLLKSLEDKLVQDGWDCQTTMMKSEYRPKYQLQQRWTCQKAGSQTFDFYMQLDTNQDQKFRVEVPPGSEVNRSQMTITIYTWLEEIIAGKT